MLAYIDNIVHSAPNSIPFSRLSASEPQCCKISPVMQHGETQKSPSLIRKKYIIYRLVSRPYTHHRPDLFSSTPPSPCATLLPHQYTNIHTASHAAWPIALARALYAPSRTNSPPTGRHDPSADDSHSPHPLPAADTTAPLTSHPLLHPPAAGCPPAAPSLNRTLAPVAMPLRCLILCSLLLYTTARLTRLTHQTLALTCDYLTVDPSAVVLPPTFSTLHALPISPVVPITTALPLLRLARPTCSSRKLHRSPGPPRIYLPRKYRPPFSDTVWQSYTRTVLSATRTPPPLQSPLPLDLLQGFSRKPRSTFNTISTAPSVSAAPHSHPPPNTYHPLLTTFISPLPYPLTMSPPSILLPPTLKLRPTTRSKEPLLPDMRKALTLGPSGASHARPPQASAGKAAFHH